MKRKSALVFILGGFLLIIAAGFMVLNPGTDSSGPEQISTAPEIGAFAPDFSLLSVNDEIVQLSDYRGKVVLINFWAVWCPPCRQEMPSIQQVSEQYPDDLVVLAVNTGDSKEDAVKFIEEFGLTFEIVLDQDYSIEGLFRVRGLPSTFFVDEQGIIQVTHIGFMEHSLLEGYLDQMGVN
jgi:thiol-disulfide isomerase/thioredoxin